MADELVAKAEAAFSEKRFEDAVEFYTEALASDEMDPKIHVGRSKAHNKLENHLEAVSDAQRAAELDPKLAAAYVEQGRGLYAMEEYESAREAFEMAAVLEPTRKVHKNWVNMCRVALGQEVEAEQVQQLLQKAAEESTSAPAAAKSAASPAPKPATSVTIDDPEFSKYWKAPAAAAAAAVDAESAAAVGKKYRHQWFQSSGKVEVNVMAKGMPKERVSVEFQAKTLRVTTRDSDGTVEYDLVVDLYGEIDPAASKYEVLGSKIEIQLVKAGDKAQWPSLEAGAAAPVAAAAASNVAPAAPAAVAPAGAPSAAYPYAGKKVDWNKVEQDVLKEEKEEDLDGDAGVMRFFRQLYGDADEDTRRAMMKSYQESGGTALSTNWKEVAQKSYKPESEA